MRLGELGTETRNPATRDLDTVSVLEVLQMMNAADRTVPEQVERVLPDIADAVELVARSLSGGGRLVYLGAGTSGRIGTLDAAECPPTFDTDPSRVIAIIAGGQTALTEAIEGAEDDEQRARDDVSLASVGPLDTVVGIAASGRTPYVITGLRTARTLGAATVSIACNVGSPISAEADVAIEVATGPEVLTGSTRLKAGTAQKLVCNMISTAAMVRTGRVYENLMIDVRPTNEKLVDRAERIVAEATGVEAAEARAALADASGSTKVAVVSLLAGVPASRAADALERAGGAVRKALELLSRAES
ncbi:N-acetylmuramic acid 6-phosphate etherase [Rhodococcoides trifolii]|uniref:N-acetylmuramic acid 6-phosphate etherase n=1 Tax=Rhodococcoides trifolii TaxID=908250 RepID=A0A917CNF3_9NOCA|nr:N-acetylmuramic acid 6-phosphate etherase [Rhodococcus trifolii]GGF93861.1 N-acetylmuramic acid 6-phosphate etherase [Rhodococcus trifolii]